MWQLGPYNLRLRPGYQKKKSNRELLPSNVWEGTRLLDMFRICSQTMTRSAVEPAINSIERQLISLVHTENVRRRASILITRYVISMIGTIDCRSPTCSVQARAPDGWRYPSGDLQECIRQDASSNPWPHGIPQPCHQRPGGHRRRTCCRKLWRRNEGGHGRTPSGHFYRGR